MTSHRQATVKEWSEGGGEAYLDDGTVVALPATALVGGPFRFLRLGQRVRLVLDGDQVKTVLLP